MGKEKKPFLALIAQLIRRSVEVRFIHAKEPGSNFREDFDKIKDNGKSYVCLFYNPFLSINDIRSFFQAVKAADVGKQFLAVERINVEELGES